MDVVPVLPHLCNFEAHPHPQYCAARSPIATYVLQSPDRSVKEALYQLQHTLRCVVCKGLLTNPAISYPSSRMFFSCGSSVHVSLFATVIYPYLQRKPKAEYTHASVCAHLTPP